MEAQISYLKNGEQVISPITNIKSIYDDNGISLLDLLHPVGSIYISVLEKSPQVIYGGKWEQIKDRFLLACGSTYKNGATGGEATHKLTVSEMPSHSHNLDYGTNTSAPGQNVTVASSDFHTTNVPIRSAGGSTAHNNMPPYLAVYIWKRIA